jgi:outer membrane protein OmpA-like peptidoglycan-associated protein
MVRRFFSLLAVGACVLAPASFAQPDLEGLPTVGIENPKDEPGELVLRLGFTFARADVPETVRMRLDTVAAVLANERGDAKVEVSGHTDAVGPAEYNQHLSEQRAASVKAYLAERGVAADRISVIGYGPAKPRATNDTIEGRRLNRRVEIKITG